MPHSESYEETFHTFDDWESDAIEAWLKERGYSWDHPTLCGSCCGFYDQEYWVTWKPGDARKFDTFAAIAGIGAKAYARGIRIDWGRG